MLKQIKVSQLLIAVLIVSFGLSNIALAGGDIYPINRGPKETQYIRITRAQDTSKQVMVGFELCPLDQSQSDQCKQIGSGMYSENSLRSARRWMRANSIGTGALDTVVVIGAGTAAFFGSAYVVGSIGYGLIDDGLVTGYGIINTDNVGIALGLTGWASGIASANAASKYASAKEALNPEQKWNQASALDDSILQDKDQSVASVADLAVSLGKILSRIDQSKH